MAKQNAGVAASSRRGMPAAEHDSNRRKKEKTHSGQSSKELEKGTHSPALSSHEGKNEKSHVGLASSSAVREKSHVGHSSDNRKDRRSDGVVDLETRKASEELEAEIQDLELENQHLLTLNRNLNLQLQGKIEELEQHEHLLTDNEGLTAGMKRLKKANKELEDQIGEFELRNEQLRNTNESLSTTNKGLRQANEDLGAQIGALKAQSERKLKGLAATNHDLSAETQELRKANEDLNEKLETLKAKADRQNQELLRVNDELLAENEQLKNAVAAYESLNSASEDMRAEIELLKTTSKADYAALRKEYEKLLQENQLLQKENQQLKDEEKTFKLDTFVAAKLQKRNENLKKEQLNEELISSLETLKKENAEIKLELQNLATEPSPKRKEEPFAVPLNDNWNSLSLGRDMYDSLFSVKVDTPHIWPDPLVWNIFYAAVPPEYTIPDPDFTNDITRNVAWGLLKPTLASRSLSYEQFLDTFAEHTSSKGSDKQ